MQTIAIPAHARRRNGTGTERIVDKIYPLTIQGLHGYFDSEDDSSVTLITSVSSITGNVTAQHSHQRPAVVIYDNSAAIQCYECRMQLNGKRQFAGHLKGDKHKRSVHRNIRLGLASLQRTASPTPTPPTAEAGASSTYAPPTAEAGAGRPTQRPTQQPTHKPVPSRPPRVRVLPTYGDPTIRIGCAHMRTRPNIN